VSYEIEVTRKVFDNDLGAHVRVQPDVDGLGLVEIDGLEEYGGRICAAPQLAMHLARAIEACALEMGAEPLK
jgi:hypothetical protein